MQGTAMQGTAKATRMTGTPDSASCSRATVRLGPIDSLLLSQIEEQNGIDRSDALRAGIYATHLIGKYRDKIPEFAEILAAESDTERGAALIGSTEATQPVR